MIPAFTCCNCGPAVGQPPRRPLGLLGLLVAHREADMTIAAIRAIVAVHATYNRDHLLAQIDAGIKDARKHETEVATVGLGGPNGRL